MGTTRTCSSCGDKFADTLEHCPKDGAALFSEEVMSRVGMRLKDYEIQGVIGEGGMGVVYRAQQVVIEKQVAIKVLHDSFARQNDMVEQFLVEAKAASRIRHPNIIDVTDFGTTPEGMVFLVMEFLDGESLEARLHRVGRLAVFEAINIVKQVARGLGAAHEVGVVHRDLKPANIFLCQREGRRRIVRRADDQTGAQFIIEPEESFDFVKLLDFGVAKLLDLGPGVATRAGMLCGSPHYLSPEQAQEKPATERSDIYSLGATFYEMVTGTVPFDGRSMLEILNGHVAGVVILPSQRAPDAAIDPRLDAVIVKSLEKDPALRFANTDEICDALRECVTDRAFLRDAHRLPGIKESGFDLSQASANARRKTPAAQGPEQGFSQVEDQREGADPADADDQPERAGGKRFPDHTMRIRRQRTNHNLRWAVLAMLAVVGPSAAVWVLRGGHKPRATAVAVVPTAPAPIVAPSPPPPPAAATAPATAPVAPLGPGSPTPTTTIAPPAPKAGPGKAPERGADKPPASRTPSALSSAGRLRLPAIPIPPEAAPVQPAVPVPLAPAPKAPEPPPSATPAVDVEALLRESQQAWTRQYYAVAIDKARAVLKIAPNRQTAHQIIAVCSCALGAADDAREAASHLDEHKRKLVQTLCQRHGVTLE
jgi:serine/threonine-protein kinase